MARIVVHGYGSLGWLCFKDFGPMKLLATLFLLNTAPAPVSVVPVNLACGIPPIPPIGCRVGPCICDQSGRYCQWQFICR